LLEKQRIYWKQRGNIKWAKLGDENTKFFYSNASIRHNKNAIRVLKNEYGIELSQYEDKASLLWDSYKEIGYI
jgi:hypothetical protein